LQKYLKTVEKEVAEYIPHPERLPEEEAESRRRQQIRKKERRG
jgi:hypothetical protein